MPEFEINLYKKWGNPDSESMDLLYGGHPDVTIILWWALGKPTK